MCWRNLEAGIEQRGEKPENVSFGDQGNDFELDLKNNGNLLRFLNKEMTGSDRPCEKIRYVIQET